LGRTVLTGAALVGMVACAAAAIRAPRLLGAALWLAASSALLAVALYALGAPYAGVIELSVGAGLVAVLFVFAIAVAGEEGMRARPHVPRWLARGLVLAPTALLWLLLWQGSAPAAPAAPAATFGQVFWGDRALDALVQLVLLFTTVLGVLNLVGPVGGDRTTSGIEEPTPERVPEREEVRA
jgi:NADH:ubiquinone oxidoreductase subunit 6 (subunit J)